MVPEKEGRRLEALLTGSPAKCACQQTAGTAQALYRRPDAPLPAQKYYGKAIIPKEKNEVEPRIISPSYACALRGAVRGFYFT